MRSEKEMMDHRTILMAIGGPTKVARRLGYSVGCVGNWMRRGISRKAYDDHRKLFDKYKAKKSIGVRPTL